MKIFKIVTSSSASELNAKIKELQTEGYRVIGSHKVVEAHKTNRYRGNQFVDTIIELEYSVSMEWDSSEKFF